MSNIIVDVEADGPCPGMYSMVSFGAVILSEGLDKTFYAQCRPLDDATAEYIPEALAVSGHSREEVMMFQSRNSNARICRVDHKEQQRSASFLGRQ